MLMLTIFIHQRKYSNQLPVTQCLFTTDNSLLFLRIKDDKPRMNRHASADICAASLEY